ncbi:hypothetical protein K438DRAFT_1843928 [Mycena galopus ATCC 62051]|nr:hypothetical protein K438DRAFT_1843928 [Mycena galopus ATCC 62051]
MLSKIELLGDAWQCDDSTNLGRAISEYLSGDFPTNSTEADLDLLAGARRSGDASNLGRTVDPSQEATREDKMTWLRTRIDGMEAELALLRAALIRLDRGMVVFMQPPQEILRTIFEFVVPPSFLLDPMISYGPESPWCQSVRAKKALINVCWTWHHAGKD